MKEYVENSLIIEEKDEEIDSTIVARSKLSNKEIIRITMRECSENVKDIIKDDLKPEDNKIPVPKNASFFKRYVRQANIKHRVDNEKNQAFIDEINGFNCNIVLIIY